MKYIILAVVVLVILILWLFYLKRRRWAIHKVKCNSEEKKLCEVNKALNPFGFTFDLKQDIVISKHDSWQRDLGYSDFFDLHAPYFHIVMDAEPIYFEYQDKEYRLEFWKGQYGITTGAEIGLYVRDIDDDSKKGFYRCANDEERLFIGFLLFKKCFLFGREDYTWWLTGFDIGKFSKPKDLKLKTCICFPNKEMRNAFIKGLLNAGYTKNKISVQNNQVYFNLCCPKNYKLNHRKKILKGIMQFFNFVNCAFYMYFTRFFNCTLDKLTYLRYMAPCLYKIIIRLSIPRRKYKKYQKKKKRNQ